MNNSDIIKYEYPTLEIDTKNNIFKVGDIDISNATALGIKLDGNMPLGKVTLEFLADIKFNGELVLNEESKKNIEELLNKTAQEVSVQEQLKPVVVKIDNTTIPKKIDSSALSNQLDSNQQFDL